jgi:outer membrane protein assembly factor BamC
MNKKILIRLISVTALGLLSACTTVKEAFPDKEKDYQFSTEIPKLTIPNDLASPSSRVSAPPASSERRITRTEETETKPSTPEEELKAAAKDAPTEESAAEPQVPMIDPRSVTVDLLESSNKISYLRINTPFLQAWRMVSKGLSRKSIEVSDRNQTDKIFTVQYDPDEQPVSDGSFEEEINFMLHGFQGNEKEYQLKLVETNQQTDIVILNDQQQPISDEASLKLLKVLQKSIKANLAGK